VLWSVFEEPISFNHSKEYAIVVPSGTYVFEIEKADKIPGPTRFVSAQITLYLQEQPVKVIKTGKIFAMFARFAPEEIVVPESFSSIVKIHVKSGVLVGSTKFSARLVQKTMPESPPLPKSNNTTEN